ncbi:MAG: hypothetical protein JWN03_6680 [Nocardia sp.]|uniref:hypothetical protein n=1 Tax=Nocardia sp. TaxID=1821 RepID=UPI002627CC71|nr:hypothetical protein [Nocardia sp.]MCU1646405.1 hypothetical protein [Nocardia sp.]
MNRLSLFLIVFIFFVIALFSAPGFVFDRIIWAAVIVFGARWFLRAASGRGGRSGMWRR